MPTTLSGTATYSNTIGAPVDGDAAGGATVSGPLQTAINNDVYLYGIVGPGGTGSKRVFQAANLPAMVALGSPADADVCFVDGYGMYRFTVTGLSIATDAIYIMANAGATGYWYHEHYKILATAHGLSQLDAAGRVAAADQRNGLIRLGSLANLSGGTTISTDGGLIAVVPAAGSGTVTFTSMCNNGDLLFVTAIAPYSVSPAVLGNTKAHFAMQVNDGGTLIQAGPEVVSTGVDPAATPVVGTFSTAFVQTLGNVGTAGTASVTFLNRYANSTAGGGVTMSQLFISAQLVRP